MKIAPLFLCVVAIGLVLGWLLPDMASDPQTSDAQGDTAPRVLAAPAPNPAPNPEPSATRAWMAAGTTLQRRADGHFHAETRVNGTAIPMLVDTGASVIALTGADARAIGLHWESADVRPVARGASGPVLGVPVMLERVALGDIDLAQVQAIIVPEGLALSLLGQSFLSRAGPMEVRDGVMKIGG